MVFGGFLARNCCIAVCYWLWRWCHRPRERPKEDEQGGNIESEAWPQESKQEEQKQKENGQKKEDEKLEHTMPVFVVSCKTSSPETNTYEDTV